MLRKVLFLGSQKWFEEMQAAVGSGYQFNTEHEGPPAKLIWAGSFTSAQRTLRENDTIYVVVVDNDVPNIGFVKNITWRLANPGDRLDAIICHGVTGFHSLWPEMVQHALTPEIVTELVNNSLEYAVKRESPTRRVRRQM